MSSSESLQSKENLTIGVKRFIATGYLQVKKNVYQKQQGTWMYNLIIVVTE